MLNVKFLRSNIGFGLLCLLFFMVSACGSTPPPANQGASPAEAQALAQSALNRMDGNQPASPAAGTAGAPAAGAQAAGSSAVRTGGRPAWVDSADDVYSRAQFVTAVGQASSREMAEANALGNLVAFFGQSIKADTTITNTYQEAVKNGVTSGWSDNLAVQNTINTSASMDTLVGAEIRDVWHDTRGNVFYAVAVMDKARTIQIYTDMILANLEMIKNLTNMSQAQRNSLEGFSRYQFAATVADLNMTYVNLINVLGAATPGGVKRGNDYRLDAQNITKSIPVGVVVRNDKSGRVQGAFAKALSDIGFQSGGNNSRYVLQVNIVVSPVVMTGNLKYSRIELSADLTDSTNRNVLLPWTFNQREGHNTQEEADNRAFTAAERKINAEYKNLLSNYLSQMLPKK
ncbi:MAG: LPP20 family lipoprotein [Treponema sp.]|jgi:hypothetical protein|nr:LPP20 family lipoprotein [Treponema sp.]